MFNGKYTNLKRVLGNIQRDYGYDNNIYKDDALEWAVRAMNLIGVKLNYDTQIDVVTVENYRATIPADLVDIIGIRNNTTKRSIVSSTDVYITSLNDQDEEPSHLISGTTPETTINPSYKIANGYIFFNFKSGEVEIAYHKYPFDDDGCLMIPDEDRYLMAIEAYIVFKIDSKLYRRGLIQREIKMESEQNWLWYVNSAANKMVTPDYDSAENINRQHQSIITDQGAHSTGFGAMNFPTIRKR